MEREAVLREPVATPRGSVHDPAEAILLTGATGFVGRFLLRELLQNTSARIYCLVRAQSPQTAALRVRTTLANWALWHEGCDDRIVAIPGDVRQRNLGLDDHSYGVLSDSVDTVFHCGASMNHLETYEMAKAANVESIQELLRPAVHRRPKLINYISTTSVFAGSEDGAALPVDETSPIDNERHRNSAGYVASKWVGEKLLMLAAEHGIACNVFRLGLVWADAEQGRYDELQREYRILHSCIASGFGIKDYHYQSAPLSVDYIARALTALASAHPQGGGRFHLCSAGQPVEDIFGQCNGVAGLKLQLLPMYDWMQEMKRLHELGRSMSVVPLIQSAFSMDENSFDDHRRRIRAAKVCCSSSQTQSALERIGIPQQFFSADLIRLCVDSMLSRDSRLRETVTRRDHAIGKHTPAVDFERMDATRCRQ
jgi:thioester reductase-like protein